MKKNKNANVKRNMVANLPSVLVNNWLRRHFATVNLMKLLSFCPPFCIYSEHVIDFFYLNDMLRETIFEKILTNQIDQ